ncbi:uncharacterized protein K452DRAFT_225511 [Aplosporella prunicola CBS 121167]|uniref:Xylanolytic transcriptional activator regulatory domain-containing protein n=1 Tax=Aplosporella prunicola CBS 121167 TaxID=1176127 RepID=A0A6A6BJG0_9PEZI|nr:uncharacterized protein K452DRAFT_225511 [Aplosporella prunicola CBS 121167]KAF2143513.1 hypothetical protein K452DRAFT_225511 [Aplosporella prunicola CBS 121167]
MRDPVAQSNATQIVQILRSFPQMMLRRTTFPPFIHPRLHRLSDGDRTGLPEPLANCMSIAHLFASRNAETSPFLWRAIEAEQHRFLQNIESVEKEELFAAIQAYIIYLIMRIVDDEAQNVGSGFHMLLSFHKLHDRFRHLCNEVFCEEEQWDPSPIWEEWIFAESRRRVACLWFLIDRVVCVKTGLHCNASEGFRELSLPSTKFTWDANTQCSWQAEYESCRMMRGTSMSRLGELIDAKQGDKDSSNARRLDVWNSGIDTLGTLLNLATAFV